MSKNNRLSGTIYTFICFPQLALTHKKKFHSVLNVGHQKNKIQKGFDLWPLGLGGQTPFGTGPQVGQVIYCFSAIVYLIQTISNCWKWDHLPTLNEKTGRLRFRSPKLFGVFRFLRSTESNLKSMTLNKVPFVFRFIDFLYPIATQVLEVATKIANYVYIMVLPNFSKQHALNILCWHNES